MIMYVFINIQILIFVFNQILKTLHYLKSKIKKMEIEKTEEKKPVLADGFKAIDNHEDIKKMINEVGK